MPLVVPEWKQLLGPVELPLRSVGSMTLTSVLLGVVPRRMETMASQTLLLLTHLPTKLQMMFVQTLPRNPPMCPVAPCRLS